MEVKNHVIYECGICGGYHPWDFNGDCRDNNNRFAGVDEYAIKKGVTENDIDVRCMCERLAADGHPNKWPCPVCGT